MGSLKLAESNSHVPMSETFLESIVLTFRWTFRIEISIFWTETWVNVIDKQII